MRAIDRFLLLGQMLDDPIGLELLRQLQRFDVALQTGPIRFPRLFLDLERRHLRRRRLQLNLIQWNIGKTKKNKKNPRYQYLRLHRHKIRLHSFDLLLHFGSLFSECRHFLAFIFKLGCSGLECGCLLFLSAREFGLHR